MKTPDVIFYYNPISVLPVVKSGLGVEKQIIETTYYFNIKEDISYPPHGELKPNIFRINYVVVAVEYLEFIYWGIARCSPKDKYCQDKGRSIARTRAFNLICLDHVEKNKGKKKEGFIYDQYMQHKIPMFLGLNKISENLSKKIESLY